MSILDQIIKENRQPRIGKKRIYVTDNWPEDKQFWDNDFNIWIQKVGVGFKKNIATMRRWVKYHQLKNGKWSKEMFWAIRYARIFFLFLLNGNNSIR